MLQVPFVALVQPYSEKQLREMKCLTCTTANDGTAFPISGTKEFIPLILVTNILFPQNIELFAVEGNCKPKRQRQ
jgi:hypothetical protein